MAAGTDRDIESFIAKWKNSAGAERANYALFLTELCDQIGVDHPDASGGERGHDYAFERPVRPRESAETVHPKRIDLYKRNTFILEAKQSRLPGKKNELPGQTSLFKEEAPLGSRTAQRGWDVMMQNARRQAEGYVFLLDADHTAPPFIIVCDVGHCFEFYADFTGTGRAYTQFPDRNGYRIFLEDLRDQKVRESLKTIWTDPHSLDPAKKAVRVTREIAARLAAVSKALEQRNNDAEDVAHFLMRCLFTMFAEDTGLLPKESFRDLLQKCVDHAETFALRIKQLWADMEKGAEFSHVIEARVKHFNGGLFANTTAFELRREEIGELLAAAKADWKEVDPAIFGTLLEQALDKEERQRLGAHYTPRAYVQRLVEVTVMEPLRADWQAALTKAEQALDEANKNTALDIVHAFHGQLCATRVLDPACGTGNFLYVALELMKQLEGEVLETLEKMGEVQDRLATGKVDPHQFLGLELNPRAAAIAELVVWIGYLQWHYRNETRHPEEPILRAFENINFGKREGYDAVLTWEGYPIPKVEQRSSERALAYPNARRPAWPEAEFIVGNPPFIGKGVIIRSALGDGYVRALRAAHPKVNQSADYVMYWWDRAADMLLRGGPLRRFGFVTTNSICQTFNRRVLQRYLGGNLHLVFAIPDHPWTKASRDAAAVRIAMTVASTDSRFGVLHSVISEAALDTDEPRIALSAEMGRINADLTIGADVSSVTPLKANLGLASMGPALGSRGFLFTPKERELLLPTLNEFEKASLTPLRNGDDLLYGARGVFVPDLKDIETDADLRARAPQLYQQLRERVYAKRSVDPDPKLRRYWWRFRRSNEDYYSLKDRLRRYIVTVETAKHRLFFFVDGHILIEHGNIAIGTDDAGLLAMLSSRSHVVWALAAGGTLEDRPRYNKIRTFDPYPFPDPADTLKAKLRALGEELDGTRKRVQAEHPDITLTGLYNALEKVKAGAELTPKEEDTKARGLVLVIKDLHDQIDAAMAEAYGWRADLTDEQILEKLVALNAERAKEEAQGFVRWLRPEYQEPRFGRQAAASKSGELDLEEEVVPVDRDLPTFPKDRYEQPLAIEAALAAHGQPLDAASIAKLFKGKASEAREKRIAEVLTTLARYGRIIALDAGTYAARRAA